MRLDVNVLHCVKHFESIRVDRYMKNKNDTVQCFTLVHVLHSHMTYLCDQAIIVSAGADTMPAIECLIIVQ